jgi:flagellar biosynthesis activator protein FlaF
MQAGAAYFQNPTFGGASPQQAEIIAFGMANEKLARAATPRERIEALRRAHTLWSVLVKDLASDSNPLPPSLKQSLLGLGFWAMSFSTRAMTNSADLQPLIDVQMNMIAGLRAQARPAMVPPRMEIGSARVMA